MSSSKKKENTSNARHALTRCKRAKRERDTHTITERERERRIRARHIYIYVSFFLVRVFERVRGGAKKR